MHGSVKQSKREEEGRAHKNICLQGGVDPTAILYNIDPTARVWHTRKIYLSQRKEGRVQAAEAQSTI